MQTENKNKITTPLCKKKKNRHIILSDLISCKLHVYIGMSFSFPDTCCSEQFLVVYNTYIIRLINHAQNLLQCAHTVVFDAADEINMDNNKIQIKNQIKS